jgi:long-subunit fatty acid transport protein
MASSAVLSGFLTLAAGSARAGNADSQLIGNQGALSGNAVTAVVSDAGAAWHNPAGLAHLERSVLNMSATAIGFRSYVMRDSLEVALPDGNRKYDLRHTEMVASPSAIVVVRKLSPDLTFALGLFLKAQGAPQQVWSQVDIPRVTGSVPSGGTYTYAQRYSVQQKGSAYHLGPSVGYRLSPTLNVGASLFLVYEQSRAFSELFSDLSSDSGTGPRTALMSQRSSSQSTFSTQGVIGVQWRPDPAWQFGLVLRSPILLLVYSFHSDALDSYTLPDGSLAPVETAKDATTGLLFSSRAPPRLHLGVARHFSWGWISLEGNVSPPKAATDLLAEQRAVWNARLGARWNVSETISVGAGIFTDLTPGRTVDRFAEGRIDYYGASGGVELRRPFSLRDGPEESKVVVSTTFAIRYGLGAGSAARVVLDTMANAFVDSPSGRARVNELDLYIGSGLSF